MKKLVVFLMALGLIMIAGSIAPVLAQITYDLYATSLEPWHASNFHIQYTYNTLIKTEIRDSMRRLINGCDP